MMRASPALLILAFLATSGCTISSKDWIEGRLERAGMPRAVAHCVADRIVDRMGSGRAYGMARALSIPPEGDRMRFATVEAMLPAVRAFLPGGLMPIVEAAADDCRTRYPGA